MNDHGALRVAALSGLAVAAAVALWWLGSTRLALEHGSDPGRSAAQALQALWLVRAALVALLCTRAAAASGLRAGAEVALAMVTPAWPLAMLAWSASSLPLAQAVTMEISLLALGAVLSPAGHGIGRVLVGGGRGVLAATIVGGGLAVGMWFAQVLWSATPP